VQILNFDLARACAQRRLPRGVFEYIDRGTEDETAILATRHAFDAHRIMPRVLRNEAPPDTRVTILGENWNQPFMVAPTACAGLVHYNGEIELARAAERFGIPFCAATEAITDISGIAHSVRRRPWFQLYVWEPLEYSLELLDHVRALGVTTLLVTVDTPVAPNREYNIRNGFDIPFRFSMRNILDLARHCGWVARVMLPYIRRGRLPDFANYPPAFRATLLGPGAAGSLTHHPRLSWDILRQLREKWPGHFVIKGILHPDDARMAVDMGAEGIVVSSHGARNFDSAMTVLDALPAIVQTVGGRLTILADSGVRRGSDIFKLLAQGAQGVLTGRAMLYGLACDGQHGATRMMQILAGELTTTMRFAGCRTVDDIRT